MIKPISQNSSIKRKCFFCGGNLHSGSRNSCPANKTCIKCGKIGHFHRVCQRTERKAAVLLMKTSPGIEESNGALLSVNEKPPNGAACLYSVLATAPSSLNSSTPVSQINRLKVDCLLDTVASNNFISANIAKTAKV